MRVEGLRRPLSMGFGSSGAVSWVPLLWSLVIGTWATLWSRGRSMRKVPGFLRPGPGTHGMSLTPHPNSQSNSQGLHRFRGWRNTHHSWKDELQRIWGHFPSLTAHGTASVTRWRKKSLAMFCCGNAGSFSFLFLHFGDPQQRTKTKKCCIS